MLCGVPTVTVSFSSEIPEPCVLTPFLSAAAATIAEFRLDRERRRKKREPMPSLTPVHDSEPPGGRKVPAWGWYRIGAWILRLAPFSWAAFESWLERAGHVTFARFVFPVLFVAVVFPAFFGLALFRCPRCRNRFCAPGVFRNHALVLAMYFFNRCQTCGLRAGQSPGEAP